MVGAPTTRLGLEPASYEPAVTQRLAKRRVEIQPRIDQWVKDGRLAETRRESSLTSEEQQADVHNPEVTYYYLCVRDEKDIEIVEALERDGLFVREADVLDTWFSSALWPHSRLVGLSRRQSWPITIRRACL